MPHIHISDPAWQTTFPFLVAPMQDQWLTGLLLRCDEAKHWGRGTTLAHLFRMDEKPTPQHLSLIVASGMKLEYLAQALVVPLRSILATTYQAELARLYAVADPQMVLLSHTSFSFRLSPTCVAEERRLSRTLVLPHMYVSVRNSFTAFSSASRPICLPEVPFGLGRAAPQGGSFRADRDRRKTVVVLRIFPHQRNPRDPCQCASADLRQGGRKGGNPCSLA